jgi:hypothetical protein
MVDQAVKGVILSKKLTGNDEEFKRQNDRIKAYHTW